MGPERLEKGNKTMPANHEGKDGNMDPASRQPRAIYEIQVQGELDPEWEAWLDGLAVAPVPGSEQLAATTLTGSVPDQAALRGLLCRLWDLNLTLISVRLVKPDGEKERASD